MPTQSSLNDFLSSASLLLHAYPTARITTRYSLPKPPKNAASTDATTTESSKEKRDPSASLTCKIYHPQSGICLKYTTDKAQEVGRLFTSLGRLAKGETIEAAVPVVGGGGGGGADGEDKMEVDSGTQVAVKEEEKVVTKPPQQHQQQGQQAQGGGGGKKKKGKGGKR